MPKLIFNGTEIADVTYTSGGGGQALQEVLTDGVVSTTSAYATANFDEAPTTEYIAITFKVNGVAQYHGATYLVSYLSSGGSNFTVYLNTDGQERAVQCRITNTSIRTTQYSGSFANITCDIRGYNLSS